MNEIEIVVSAIENIVIVIDPTAIETVTEDIDPDLAITKDEELDLEAVVDIENAVENAVDPEVQERLSHVVESLLYIGMYLLQDSNMFLHCSIKRCKVNYLF